MIQMGSILEVADNSGARKIACIHCVVAPPDSTAGWVM